MLLLVTPRFSNHSWQLCRRSILKLAGKVALVTGSSQGIGQAIAIGLATEGANAAINYRSNPEGAQETVNKVEASGGNAIQLYALKLKYTPFGVILAWLMKRWWRALVSSLKLGFLALNLP